MAKSTLPDLSLREDAKSAAKEVKKNPDLAKVFEKIDEQHRSLMKRDVLGRYEIGREVARVIDDESKYGSGAVKLLAAALLMNESDLYKWKNLTLVWTADEIKVLCEKRTAQGSTLSVAHFTMLAALPKEGSREKLLSRCFKESLTVRDLAGIVQERFGVRSNNPKGRKARIKSPTAGAAELDKISDKWLDIAEHFDEFVCEPLDKKPEEYATQELADQLTDLKKTAQEVSDTAESSLAKIEAAHEKVVKALQAQEEKRAQEAAEKKNKKKLKLKAVKKGKKKKKLKLKLKNGGSKKSAIKKAKAKAESNGDAEGDVESAE